MTFAKVGTSGATKERGIAISSCHGSRRRFVGVVKQRLRKLVQVARVVVRLVPRLVLATRAALFAKSPMCPGAQSVRSAWLASVQLVIHLRRLKCATAKNAAEVLVLPQEEWMSSAGVASAVASEMTAIKDNMMQNFAIAAGLAGVLARVRCAIISTMT